MKRMLRLLKGALQKPYVRILIGLSILGLVLSQLPLGDLWHTLRQVSPLLWLLSVGVFLTGHLLGSLKWRLLINIGRRRLSWLDAFRAHFAGLFANLCLPSLAGGDVVRAGIAIRATEEKEPVVLGSLLDRFLDTCSLGLIILIGAVWTPGLLAPGDRKVLIWIFSLLSILPLSGLLLVVLPLPKALPGKLRNIVINVRTILRHLMRHPSRALIALGLSVIIQGGFVLLNAFLGRVCGISLALPIWFLVWPLAKLSAMLPISMGGLGVREAALAVLLGRFGIASSRAVGLGLLWETILIAGGGIGGLLYLALSRDRSRSDVLVAARTPREPIQREAS